MSERLLDVDDSGTSSPELLTADELARALKVSIAAVRVWQRQGVPFVPIGRLRRYVLRDVIAWHQARAQTAKRSEKKSA
jgi:phage terminase Nu1 subunit (DNA packaging protein)